MSRVGAVGKGRIDLQDDRGRHVAVDRRAALGEAGRDNRLDVVGERRGG